MLASRAAIAQLWALATDMARTRPPCLQPRAKHRLVLVTQAGVEMIVESSLSAQTNLAQAMASAAMVNALAERATLGIHATSLSSLAGTGVDLTGRVPVTLIQSARARMAGLALAVRSRGCSARTIATATGPAWTASVRATFLLKAMLARA